MSVPGRGLYDGFEGYRTAQVDDLAALLSSGIVALDTNVLLDLYRFGAEARDEFLGVLQRLSERLFVPYQVMQEFWRNRVAVLEEVVAGGTEAELRKARAQTMAIVDRWRGRTRADQEASIIRVQLDTAYDEVEAIVQRVGGQLNAAEAQADTGKDPVLLVLARVLDGSIGQPFERSRLDSLIAAGRRRFDEEIPPGYLDAAKQGQYEEGTGDYLVWEQVIAYALEMKLDLLFVSRDSKPDWWRVDRSHRLLGPRVELVQEFYDRTSRRFMMIRPQDLLSLAPRILDVAVSASTIRDANRLSELSDNAEPTRWDRQSLGLLLERLRQWGYTTRAMVIEEAGGNGGSISRDRIYEIGKYEPDRMLTGYTKPVIRAVDALIDEKLIPAGIETPLFADFANGPGRATGYSVAASIVAATDEADART